MKKETKMKYVVLDRVKGAFTLCEDYDEARKQAQKLVVENVRIGLYPVFLICKIEEAVFCSSDFTTVHEKIGGKKWAKDI